jgi:hypothetical protein
MADEQDLALLSQGVDAWNRWREENPELDPDLCEAQLRGAELSGANLGQADLLERGKPHWRRSQWRRSQ